MTIRYTPAIFKGGIHKLTIETEVIETTEAKKVLEFARTRVFDKAVWKEVKEAVRLGTTLTVDGGGLFGDV